MSNGNQIDRGKSKGKQTSKQKKIDPKWADHLSRARYQKRIRSIDRYIERRKDKRREKEEKIEIKALNRQREKERKERRGRELKNRNEPRIGRQQHRGAKNLNKQSNRKEVQEWKQFERIHASVTDSIHTPSEKH